MVPRITQAGRSFKGAHLYYGHDKQAATRERVVFFETLNLRTQDPDKAWKLMAWTAEHEEALKRQNGLKWNGEKTQKPVYAFSLAWGVDEKPSPEDMKKAAQSALSCRRLDGHQAILYGHDDTEHKHVHVLVNLIHPQTGRCASTYKDRLELSRWAQAYEEQQGKIRCEQRVENNKRREHGQFVKYREEAVQKAWDSTKTGKDFAAELEKQGYRLAQGNKRIVIVDPDGKVFNPTRKLQGVKAAEILEKLKGMALPQADAWQKQPAGRPSTSQATPLPEKESKPLQDTGQQKDPQSKERVAIPPAKTPLPRSPLRDQSNKIPKPPDKAVEAKPYRSFAERLDRLQAFEHKQQQKKDQLEQRLQQFYDPSRTERLLIEARKRVAETDSFIGRMTGKHQQALDDAAAYQKNAENLRWRIEEQRQALENRLRTERQPFEREKPDNSPTPAPHSHSMQTLLERFKQAEASGNDNEKAKDQPDQSNGPLRQRSKDRDPGGYER